MRFRVISATGESTMGTICSTHLAPANDKDMPRPMKEPETVHRATWKRFILFAAFIARSAAYAEVAPRMLPPTV
eukprot:CAMPEP_0114155462 /NCGR_PEP_ID=MMETSP0043_2-20121206/25493_1 /TAXON_ID=464988 /ORGANISM="Hemiselmis andersenii, Strain CCMP644" /LENGTH=73 /DNA_ID=CAMNT_0001250749 /DNA_START=99 /DNA_END=320 /DNA_ORIENTATION=-